MKMADGRERAAIFAATARHTREVVLLHKDSGVGDRVHVSAETTERWELPGPLPPLPPAQQSTPPSVGAVTVEVVQEDAVTAVLRLARPDAGTVCVLNLASELNPGGGVVHGALAQEECLCYCSTLHHALMAHPGYYPLPDIGGLYTRDVLFFRDARYRMLDWGECVFADVISVAAVRWPPVVKGHMNNTDLARTNDKIRAMLRTSARHNVRTLMLGAFGCGAFVNLPADVAGAFRAILSEAEFYGRFERVIFAIIDGRGTSNYNVFHAALHGLAVGRPL